VCVCVCVCVRACVCARVSAAMPWCSADLSDASAAWCTIGGAQTERQVAEHIPSQSNKKTEI